MQLYVLMPLWAAGPAGQRHLWEVWIACFGQRLADKVECRLAQPLWFGFLLGLEGFKDKEKKKTNLPLPGSDANLRRSKFDSLNKGSSVLRFSKKLSSVHWCFVFLVGVQYFGDSFCILGKEWECTIQKQNISECDTGTLAK